MIMIRVNHASRGFTLLELMITITVAAILAVIAVPSFMNVIRRSDVTSASNALLADISYARTEAINRGGVASICASSDGKSCSTDGATFENGWIVYTYAPGAAVASSVFDDSKPTTNILLRYSAQKKSVSIQSSSSDVLSFGSQGQTLPQNSAYTLDICYQPGGSSGHGSSTVNVPGSQLTVSGSGAVTTKNLGVLADCSP